MHWHYSKNNIHGYLCVKYTPKVCANCSKSANNRPENKRKPWWEHSEGTCEAIISTKFPLTAWCVDFDLVKR
jgi:hypothetical protein